MSSVSRVAAAAFAACLISAMARAQTPQPFPRPGNPKPVIPAPTVTEPQAPTTPPPAPAAPPTSTPASDVPNETTLGVQIYPSAEFIASYDAGRGQRYYLFGTTASFADIVNYYKTMLKQKGELVYEEPPIHEFDIGRFREESMAFPPSVTVKDFSWGGSAGYLNPKRGAKPERFRTIIQIVPAPPGEPR